ncbi:hypothetical protein NQ315_011992 [Exocentrus adspersus]|uniref:Uncharacterized protein n=1 Tax=Exocentrus adspersus TaxID=1586481 RepID=A0AAV8W2Q1_9CUCU|nr:hypothetical protein NQ315_011992 [Exocentrus adspersus]
MEGTFSPFIPQIRHSIHALLKDSKESIIRDNYKLKDGFLIGNLMASFKALEVEGKYNTIQLMRLLSLIVSLECLHRAFPVVDVYFPFMQQRRLLIKISIDFIRYPYRRSPIIEFQQAGIVFRTVSCDTACELKAFNFSDTSNTLLQWSNNIPNLRSQNSNTQHEKKKFENLTKGHCKKDWNNRRLTSIKPFHKKRDSSDSGTDKLGLSTCSLQEALSRCLQMSCIRKSRANVTKGIVKSFVIQALHTQSNFFKCYPDLRRGSIR